MRRRRILFYHFSKIRVLARKFAIVILILSAFVLMLLNKTDTVIVEKTSTVAVEVVSPVMDVLLVPARTISGIYDYFRDLKRIHKDNEELVQENKRLLALYDRARALDIENRILSRLLNYTPPPEATSFTARIIAEEGDAFSHSIIVYIGGEYKARKGQVVLGDRGVIGRVESVGKNYAKIILVTDINSKIPVIVERTRVRGILSGDNTLNPKMMFIPLQSELTVGDRIVTSGVAGTFPPGLPIGKIGAVDKNNVKIHLFTDLDRLEYVRIVDYGLLDIVSENFEEEQSN